MHSSPWYPRKGCTAI